jgi:hypothetical protein
MKRLFKVIVPDGTIQYFDNKMRAKHMRNQHKGALLRRGPDHREGETF